MSTIQELFQQAQLAQAAYANLSGITISTPAGTLESALINTNTGGSFTPAQAAAFASRYQVIDQYTAPSVLGVTGSGFSATVFLDRTTLKGSEPFKKVLSSGTLRKYRK